MRITVGAGTYVVAVSGGVDSMVLLDLLQKRPGLKLTVAHFDHGIRKDSDQDRKLVQKIAKKHNLSFVHENGNLGPGASEAVARKARYKFLNSVKNASEAKAVITAHHEDDVLETAIINMVRGTGRLGLTSLKSTDGIVRPLLGYSKEQILEYAVKHSIAWREDPTNQNTIYLRNYIRSHVMPYFSPGKRAELVILLENMHTTNDEIDNQISSLLHIQPALNEINREWFIDLPHSVAKELIHAWLRKHGANNITKTTIDRITVAMKTAKSGRIINIDGGLFIRVGKDKLALIRRER